MIENEIGYDGWLTRTTLILVSGRAGVGKTTFSNLFMDLLPDDRKLTSRKASFAVGVKNVATLMGWDGNKDERGRTLLQDIGKIARAYDKDTWINFLNDFIAGTSIVPPDLIIIDDWRFPNEFNWYLKQLDEYDVYTIKIVAPNREILKGTDRYNDESETALNYFKTFDYIIDNTGSMDELKAEALAIMVEILDLEED